MASHRGFGETGKLRVVDGADVGQGCGRGGKTRAKHDGHLGAGGAQMLANRFRGHQHSVMKAGR